jgi:hypothetical protein
MRLCGLSRREPELGPAPRLLREPLSGLSPTWPLDGLGSGRCAPYVRNASLVIFMEVSLACGARGIQQKKKARGVTRYQHE